MTALTCDFLSPAWWKGQVRGKMTSIDLEIDSLSSMLDDMQKNDPFKSRVSCITG